MSVLEQIERFKDYGFVYVPVNPETKKPKTVETKEGWEWKSIPWTEEDLVQAGAVGIQHEKSNIIDVDFDNETAIKFKHLLPKTFTFQSPGGIHMLYRYPGETRPYKTYADRKRKDSVIVEVLHNTQTVFLNEDKSREILNPIKPVEIDEAQYERLLKQVGKIATLTMLSEHYPGQGGRDEYIMKVTGCLVRYSKLNTSEKEEFIEELCKANDDTDELRNRVNKIKYVEEKHKQGQRTYGLDSLSKELDISKSIVGNWFNYIGDQSISNTTPITSLRFSEMLHKDYPPTKYLMFPVVPDPCIVEIFGAEGAGKSIFTAGLITSIISGKDFLKYKNQNLFHQKIRNKPVLLVDGEMPEADLLERFNDLFQPVLQEVDMDMLSIASLAEQLNHSFDPLNTELGQTRLELRLEQLTKEHNKKPVLILDNLTYLTELQEKDGFEFISFMKWLIRLRSKGYCVIFLHHATKEGSTSSGSNVKERPLDVNIQLSIPQEDERVPGNNDTQIIVSIKKMRRHSSYDLKQKFIATVSKHTGAWSFHKYEKMTAKKKFVIECIAAGETTWNESMKDECSKGQFYKYLKQLNSDKPTTEEDII